MFSYGIGVKVSPYPGLILFIQYQFCTVELKMLTNMGESLASCLKLNTFLLHPILAGGGIPVKSPAGT